MKYTVGKLSMILVILIFLNGCSINHTAENEGDKLDCDEVSISESNENFVYQPNDSYKIFYGTWKYTEIVSQHSRIGGDEGYEEVLGKTVTYSPGFFENGNNVQCFDPTYLMNIYPIYRNMYNQFFENQIGIEEMLPKSDYFVYIQIVNKPLDHEVPYYGTDFIIIGDQTIYAFDYNCIYKLTRVSYLEDYNPDEIPTYQERW